MGWHFPDPAMKPHAPRLSVSPFFFKWIFPALWLGMLGLLITKATVTGQKTLPLSFLVAPVLVGVFGFFFFKHFFWVLADGVIDQGDHLRVRKGRIEERIPFTNMLNVAAPRASSNPPQISIRLRRPCSLGDEIIFLPKRPRKVFWPPTPFVRNPIAEDLMLCVDAARRQV